MKVTCEKCGQEWQQMQDGTLFHICPCEQSNTGSSDQVSPYARIAALERRVESLERRLLMPRTMADILRVEKKGGE